MPFPETGDLFLCRVSNFSLGENIIFKGELLMSEKIQLRNGAPECYFRLRF